MNIFRGAARHMQLPAVQEAQGCFRYNTLLSGAAALAQQLRGSPDWSAGTAVSVNGTRVGILAQPGEAFVRGLLATWLAGGIAVPLCTSHPPRELQYALEDSQAGMALATPSFQETLQPITSTLGARLHMLQAQDPASERNIDEAGVQQALRQASPEASGALIMYTSGTTGRPKGVLHTHGGLGTMTSTLTQLWGWEASDRILHCLPLHHIHGLGNALLCPLLAGACVEFHQGFSPSAVWAALQRREDPITVFMGVPTMYAYLLSAYEAMDEAQQAPARVAARRLRLAVCGSAPCPAPVYQAWERLTGQRLLDRYGMTETGMLLSNPLHGERRPGTVGQPLPGIEARLVSQEVEAQEGESQQTRGAQSASGELLVRGRQLFKEYWNRPEATAKDLSPDGWFRTGDIAEVSGDPPYFTLLGRASADIIKAGGYKISALGIENVIAAHPHVREVAVLGLPHDTLGEEITAVVACQEPHTLTLDDLKQHTAAELPPYQIPRRLHLVDAIPRNAMGKVNKKELAKSLQG